MGGGLRKLAPISVTSSSPLCLFNQRRISIQGFVKQVPVFILFYCCTCRASSMQIVQSWCFCWKVLPSEAGSEKRKEISNSFITRAKTNTNTWAKTNIYIICENNYKSIRVVPQSTILCSFIFQVHLYDFQCMSNLSLASAKYVARSIYVSKIYSLKYLIFC